MLIKPALLSYGETAVVPLPDSAVPKRMVTCWKVSPFHAAIEARMDGHFCARTKVGMSRITWHAAQADGTIPKERAGQCTVSKPSQGLGKSGCVEPKLSL
jgi:hypothetical protein